MISDVLVIRIFVDFFKDEVRKFVYGESFLSWSPKKMKGLWMAFIVNCMKSVTFWKMVFVRLRISLLVVFTVLVSVLRIVSIILLAVFEMVFRVFTVVAVMLLSIVRITFIVCWMLFVKIFISVWTAWVNVSIIV